MKGGDKDSNSGRFVVDERFSHGVSVEFNVKVKVYKILDSLSLTRGIGGYSNV